MRAFKRGGALVLLLALAIIALLSVPVSWLTQNIESGPWSISDIEGSVYSGSANLRYADADHHSFKFGRWHWHVLTQLSDLGRVEVTSAGPPLRGGFKIHYAGREWRLTDIRAEAQLREFSPLAPALEMVGLTGQLQVSSPLCIIKPDGPEASIDVSLTGVRSARVSRAVLGHYHGRFVLRDAGPYFIVSTDAGPLHVDGRGRFNLQGQWGFVGRAWLDTPAQKDLLDFLRSAGRLTEREELFINMPYPGQ